MNYNKMTKGQKTEYWHGHVAAYQKSDLTAKEYCKREKLIPSTFRDWKKKLKNTSSEVKITEIPIKLSNFTKTGIGFELIINEKLYLRIPKGFDADTFMKLLACLGARQ